MPVMNPLGLLKVVVAIVMLALAQFSLAANQVPEPDGPPDLTGLGMAALLDLDVTPVTKTSAALAARSPRHATPGFLTPC